MSFIFDILIKFQADLHTITTVAASKSFKRNRLWLNGTETEINGRAQTVIRECRKLAQDRVDPETGVTLVKKEDWSQYGIHIASVNTFPTGLYNKFTLETEMS